MTSATHCHMHGDGIYSDAKAFIKRRIDAVREDPSTKPSFRLTKFLDNNKNHIVKLQVGRRPLLAPLRKALDVITFGRFSKKARQLNYDNVYHNYMLITLDDGRVVKIEKNEVVSESTASRDDLTGELFEVPLNGQQLSVKTLIDTASAGNQANFYKYRANSDNCQKFTRDIVVKNGLLPDQDIQDADALVGTIPGKSLIPNTVTDIAAVGQRLLAGDGIKKFRCPL
jgi:hypothetical protein